MTPNAHQQLALLWLRTARQNVSHGDLDRALQSVQMSLRHVNCALQHMGKQT